VPSGRAHETINLVTFGLIAGGYAYARAHGASGLENIVTPRTAAAFSASYLVGTFLVTPDLDLAENRVRAKSNWGLLGLLWVPYGAIFSHRGLSHTWFVGPLTRLLYLVMLALALSWLVSALGPTLGYHFSIGARLGSSWPGLALGALVGYYLSQWLHLIADGIAPDHGFGLHKRRRR
jgi:uncharacterized metal-binding protein